MPCYNAAETLQEAVASVRSQSWQDWELLAVNDGSKDSTARILQHLAAADSRIRPIDIPHSGIITALNTGLAYAEGKVIARFDADDRMHPDRLSRQWDYLQRFPEIAAVSCLVESFPAENTTPGFQHYLDWLNGLVSPEAIAREIYIESPLPHPSMMIRLEWLVRMDGYQENGWPEDYDLWLRMHTCGARFAKVSEVLVYWRDHGNRLTRTDTRYSVENFIRAKAHYLAEGILQERDAVFLWGAGQMGRRLSKYLLRAGVPIKAVFDVDARKIGRTMRSLPIHSHEEIPVHWKKYSSPLLLAAVGSHRARHLIREWLGEKGYVEGVDWWAAA
ncbi:MAG: glycosyltransferase [Anaerolineales bacterium]|nr:glycosyltransferase [Anaerolineales bacterium]